MDDPIFTLMSWSISLIFILGLVIVPFIRSWRNNHKGWAWAILLLTPFLFGVVLGIVSYGLKLDQKWPFEKGFESLAKAEKRPEGPSFSNLVESRLKTGTIFVPAGQSYRFPPYCVNCLRPSVETKEWEGEHQSTGSDPLNPIRGTITTTIKRKITGIPYCSECADLSADMARIIKRINWFAAVAGLVIAVILFTAASSNQDFTIACISWPIASAVLLILVRSLLLFKYPNIWKGGAGKGLIGIKKAEMSEKVGGAGNLGVWLTFTNKDYMKMFLADNNFKYD